MNVLKFSQQYFSQRTNTCRSDIRRKDDVRIVYFVVRDVSTYVNRNLIECWRIIFTCFNFLECLRFESKKEFFQSLRDFDQLKLEFDIWRVKYLLKKQIKRRLCNDESFARSIFFYSRRRSRVCFLKKKSNFKVCHYNIFIISKLVLFSWDLI